jgi:hypothetical protein
MVGTRGLFQAQGIQVLIGKGRCQNPRMVRRAGMLDSCENQTFLGWAEKSHEGRAPDGSMRWCTPLVLALGRQRQVCLSEFEASLVYIERFCLKKMEKWGVGGLCSCLILPRLGRWEAGPSGQSHILPKRALRACRSEGALVLSQKRQNSLHAIAGLASHPKGGPGVLGYLVLGAPAVGRDLS